MGSTVIAGWLVEEGEVEEGEVEEGEEDDEPSKANRGSEVVDHLLGCWWVGGIEEGTGW